MKAAIREVSESPPRSRRNVRKVMSRIEWIAQIQEIYSTLIKKFNREYFKKDIVTEMIRGAEPVCRSVIEKILSIFFIELSFP